MTYPHLFNLFSGSPAVPPHIPVLQLEADLPVGRKPFLKLLSDGHRAVLSAGAADGDDQLVLPLQHVVRKKKFDQIAQLFHENIRGSALLHEILHFLLLARPGPQMLLIVGVGKKPHVEHQVDVYKRQALSRLEQEGLVEIKTKRGVTVSPLSINDVNMIFEVRTIYETYILRNYGPLIPEKQLARFYDIFHVSYTHLSRR